jgi:hypothetical protein
MSGKPKDLTGRIKNPVSNSRNKRFWWLVFSATILCISFLFYWNQRRPDPTSSPILSSTDAKSPSISNPHPRLEKLVGRWQRPDGGYILEIRKVGQNGLLEASYFNPKSINVSKAEWVIKDSNLYVLVELRDVNYPGSTYGLEYNEQEDHLTGTYYQAVEKSTFEVEFVREN